MPTAFDQEYSNSDAITVIARIARQCGVSPNSSQEKTYLTLGAWIAALHKARGSTVVIGICGAQGSGKSTAAAFIQALLEELHVIATAVLSLDDFYLSHAARQQLAADIHPLFATRGVPGTHDVTAAVTTINSLVTARAGEETVLPRFDKATDDPIDLAACPIAAGPTGVVILEGWCVGVGPEADDALMQPVNVLEVEEDPEGTWRRYVNAQLAGPYRLLFDKLDGLVLLAAPSFDVVYGWRKQQEGDLIARSGNLPAANLGLMDDAHLARFITHFERLTRHVLATLPERSNAVIKLDADRKVQNLTFTSTGVAEPS